MATELTDEQIQISINLWKGIADLDPPQAIEIISRAFGTFVAIKATRVRDQMAVYDLAVEQLWNERDKIEGFLLHTPKRSP